jgi:hypothetical protein
MSDNRCFDSAGLGALRPIMRVVIPWVPCPGGTAGPTKTAEPCARNAFVALPWCMCPKNNTSCPPAAIDHLGIFLPVFWDDLPQPDGPGLPIQILTVPNSCKVFVRFLSPSRGVWLHWTGKRSEPCLRERCPHCLASAAHWMGPDQLHRCLASTPGGEAGHGPPRPLSQSPPPLSW